MTALAVAVAAAAAMEPIAAWLHRRSMHAGRGWGWHRSHHATRGRGWERNDWFPVAFAVATVAAMALGAAAAPLRFLLWAGAGVTAYGAAYFLVHDVCVHGRLAGRPLVAGRYLRWVAANHGEHHRTGRAPYGFLVPVMPRNAPAMAPSLRGVDTRARVENTS